MKDGAHLVVDPEQALEDLLAIARAQGVDPVSSSNAVSITAELQTIYNAITAPTTADDISVATKLEAKRVSSALTELELDGLVECVRGRWCRTDH